MKLEDIISKYEHPVIGVIGAASPLPGYDSADSYRLGYELRELIENGGSLFTGGVSGIGTDFYEGVVDYCSERGLEDRFFILFPEGLQPSKAYFKLAEKTKNGTLRIERAGKNLEERRSYVGAIADALILVNGAEGTIDEALKGLLLGKPLVCLQNSGGAADVICKLKSREVKIPLEINTDLIKPFDSITDIVKYLSNGELYNLGEKLK